MTCHTCRFYRPDTCRRRSPSATGWPFVQPDDICGEWEAAIAIPEAMQQLGEMRDVGVAGGWRNDRLPTAEDAEPGLRVWTWNSLDGEPKALLWPAIPRGLYWAPGSLPAPTIPPPGWKPPAPPAPRWIVDRVPTVEDRNKDGEVAVSARPDAMPGNVYWYTPWRYVHPGTPWAPTDAIPDEPFDPTTLDRNGWIRSRLPGEGDDRGQKGWVQIPPSAVSGTVPGLVGWAPLANIVPGQPWAPADSIPGEYQP